MRGTQNLCFDLLDTPDIIKELIRQLDGLFFKYYDAMYDIVKNKDGSSSYTAFKIWGPGKTSKIQCDFSSIMSPEQFREFVLPSLKRECVTLDKTLYHLDGTDAIKHLDAVLEIEELNAVQWEPGDYNVDGGAETWYPLYDKIRAADKGLWIAFREGKIEDWIYKAEKLVKRYGSSGLYLIFPIMSESYAKEILKAANGWH
jgi:5-methyltetrahydrofolate--homocysteine methyltransferase